MLNGRPRNGSGAKDSPWPTGCAWPSATDWTPTYGRPTKPGELATGGYGRSADPWSLERSEVTARGSGRHLIGYGRPTKPGELATGGYGRSADPWSLERSEVTARGSGRHLIGRGLGGHRHDGLAWVLRSQPGSTDHLDR